MKKEIISRLHSNFELAAHQVEDVEFWFARDPQALLGYAQWRNFLLVMEKAKTACSNAKQEVSNHFADVNKRLTSVLEQRRSAFIVSYSIQGKLDSRTLPS